MSWQSPKYCDCCPSSTHNRTGTGGAVVIQGGSCVGSGGGLNEWWVGLGLPEQAGLVVVQGVGCVGSGGGLNVGGWIGWCGLGWFRCGGCKGSNVGIWFVREQTGK